MSRPARRQRIGRRLRSTHASAWSSLALLTGCGLFSGDPEVAAPCPPVQVLQGAEAVSSYQPGRQGDPSALRYVAGMGDLSSTCRYAGDGVEVEIALNLLVERGPALEGEAARLDYFVATVAPGQQIQSKQLLTSDVSLPAGQQTAGVREELTLRLPLMAPAGAARLSVFLGFQLDESDLRRERPMLRGPAPEETPPEGPGGAPSPSP